MSSQLQRAVKSNDKHIIAMALRNEVWRSINDEKTGGRDIAALVRRWLELSNEIGDKNRKTLEKLRDVVAARINTSESGRDIAALSKRLIDIIGEIDALPDEHAEKSPAQKAREMVKKRGT